VLLVGAGGRLGELGDQSTLQAVSNGPQPDEVRNTVAGLERKVEQGFLYADMLDTDQFVNFTRKAVVKTLEKAIGLQVRLPSDSGRPCTLRAFVLASRRMLTTHRYGTWLRRTLWTS
jgi:hypothetical protein